MKTAIIYTRVSTQRQADDGLSIEGQIEQGQRKADQLDARVLRIFKDEGISGRTSDRPSFQDAIDYARVYDVDYFIVWNTARFARNKADAAWYKRLLKKGGTKIVYVSNDIDSETDEGWILEGFFEMMDEQYSRTVSKDTRRSMIKNASDGYYNGGTVPFGYSAAQDGKRKRLVINEAQAIIVREIFRHYIHGAGVKSIVMSLNRSGRLRPGGVHWSKNHIIYMLKNKVYCGYLTFNRFSHAEKRHRPREEWVQVKSHDPIISEEDYMKVQELFGQRAPTIVNGSSKSKFLFTGLLRCGACDASMQIETATGRSKIYSYYNCRAALRGDGCSNRRIPADELDRWLLQHVLDQILTERSIMEIVQQVYDLKNQTARDRETRRSSLVSEMRNIESRRKRLFDILELGGADTPNLGDLKPRLTVMNARILEIERALTALEDQPAAEIQIKPEEIDQIAHCLREMVENCDNSKKLRDFLSSFIQKVVIGAEEAVIHYQPEKLVDSGGGPLVQSGGIRHPTFFCRRSS